MTKIMSVDPGKRTGVVYLTFDDTTPAEIVDSWDIPGGAQGFLDFLETHKQPPRTPEPVDFVVYESFTVREGVHGVGTDAPEVIGVLLSWLNELELPAASQPPAGRKKAVPDKVLYKFYRFWGKQDRNAKEAARHGLWYLKNAKHMPTIRKGWLDG